MGAKENGGAVRARVQSRHASFRVRLICSAQGMHRNDACRRAPDEATRFRRGACRRRARLAARRAGTADGDATDRVSPRLGAGRAIPVLCRRFSRRARRRGFRAGPQPRRRIPLGRGRIRAGAGARRRASRPETGADRGLRTAQSAARSDRRDPAKNARRVRHRRRSGGRRHRREPWAARRQRDRHRQPHQYARHQAP